MTTTIDHTLNVPVSKSITVKAGAAHAFQVFTEGFDTWWPRSHHIGKSPMKKAIIEGKIGGRCYSEQIDGTDCDWGQILVWEPPQRFVIAWQISPGWGYEPDLAKSSEVEVRFTPEPDGSTPGRSRTPLFPASRRGRGSNADGCRWPDGLGRIAAGLRHAGRAG